MSSEDSSDEDAAADAVVRDADVLSEVNSGVTLFYFLLPRRFVKILPQMCLGTRKNRLNLGTRPILDHKDTKTEKRRH